MRRMMQAAVLAAFLVPSVGAEEQPSVKQGLKEAGQAIKDDTITGYEKAKAATLHGVGTAIDKTGEGLNKAGEKIEGAGEKVEDKAE